MTSIIGIIELLFLQLLIILGLCMHALQQLVLHSLHKHIYFFKQALTFDFIDLCKMADVG